MSDEEATRRIAAELQRLGGLQDRLNALDKPERGSRAAKSAKRPMGSLHSIFAIHSLVSAVDHVRAWKMIWDAGQIPIGAHLALLRGALEGAAMCRYLVDVGVVYQERIRRGAVAQLEDWRQRERYERSAGIGIAKPWPTPGKSGAERVAQHVDRMRRAGMIGLEDDPKKVRPPDMTTLMQANATEPIWRLSSAFAHSSPWSGLTLAWERSNRPSLDDSVRIKVQAQLQVAASATMMAMGTIDCALVELEAHYRSE